MFKNDEGYKDPTAGLAISHYMKDYKAKQRDRWRREEAIKSRPMVYVISPYAGDIEENTAAAIRYCQYAIERNKIPLASHLLYPAMLDDTIPEQRELGRMFGLSMLALCQEAWVFTEKRSDGMKAEIKEASYLGIPVRFFMEDGYGKIFEQRDPAGRAV